ncbi:MAG: LapA family protein [Proteobacteria bacterium]|nr:LapA family protein [Pseudomonadota bacterium]
MKKLKALGLGLLVALLLLFVAQNLTALQHSQSLRLDLLFTRVESPPLQMFFLLITCFFLGFVLAYGLGYMERRRLKKTVKALKNHYARTEEELQSLRNLPVTGDVPSGVQAETSGRKDG